MSRVRDCRKASIRTQRLVSAQNPATMGFFYGWVSLDIRGTVLTVQSPKVSPAQWQVDPT